mmetsp:Transcript_14018/g.45749  ORF Transcript_14018/g.45749 Transcript_14018/m.45749 type:complete len:291 (+) Transcript_14018:55-927(+)
MLKVLEPRAFEQAMFPQPWRAAVMDAKRFGRLVPTAEKVIPITASDSPRRSPRVSQREHMKNDKPASQQTHCADATAASRPEGFSNDRTSRIVTWRAALKGQRPTCAALSARDAPASGHATSDEASPPSSDPSSGPSSREGNVDEGNVDSSTTRGAFRGAVFCSEHNRDAPSSSLAPRACRPSMPTSSSSSSASVVASTTALALRTKDSKTCGQGAKSTATWGRPWSVHRSWGPPASSSSSSGWGSVFVVSWSSTMPRSASTTRIFRTAYRRAPWLLVQKGTRSTSSRRL